MPLKPKEMLFIKLLLKCHHKEKSISTGKKCCSSVFLSSRDFQMKIALFESQEMIFLMAVTTLLVFWLYKLAPVAAMHLGGGEHLLFYQANTVIWENIGNLVWFSQGHLPQAAAAPCPFLQHLHPRIPGSNLPCRVLPENESSSHVETLLMPFKRLRC